MVLDELEVSLFTTENKICIATLAELVLDEGGYHNFVVFDTCRCTGVADAARFSEQTKKERSQHERLEKEMNRTYKSITSKSSTLSRRDN